MVVVLRDRNCQRPTVDGLKDGFGDEILHRVGEHSNLAAAIEAWTRSADHRPPMIAARSGDEGLAT